MNTRTERVLPILLVVIIVIQINILVLILSNDPEKQLISKADNQQPVIYQKEDVNKDVFAGIQNNQADLALFLKSIIKKTIKEELVALDKYGIATHETQQTQEYFDEYQIQESNNALQIIESQISSLSESSAPEEFHRIRELTLNLTPNDYENYYKKVGEMFMNEEVSPEMLQNLL